MDPNDQPAMPAPETFDQPADGVAAAPETRVGGFRRSVLTAGMAAALLVAGGVAAVSAASPDPSASPTPATSTTPSDGATTPSTSTTPGSGTHGNCPKDGTTSGTPNATPTPAS